MTIIVEDDAAIKLDRIAKGEGPYAIIHALLPIHAQRLLSGKHDVFGKYSYSRYSEVGESLADCEKLLIYESHACKQIVGESKITGVFLMKSEEIVSRYGKRFFLKPEELLTYSRSRERPLVVFELESVKRYSHPVCLRKTITMAGQYVGKQTYNRMIGDAFAGSKG